MYYSDRYEYWYSKFDRCWFPLLIISIIIALLIFSLVLIYTGYVCDSHQCRAFEKANNKGITGSAPYLTELTNNICNEGMWPWALLGSIIIAPVSLWLMRQPITILNFFIIFVVSFFVIYFLLSFFGHHYVRPIVSEVNNHINENCICLANEEILV